MEFPNPVITQVSREPEHKTYSTTHITDKKASNGSVKSKKKKDSTNSTFHSLLCCMRRPRKLSLDKRKSQSDERLDQFHSTPDPSVGSANSESNGVNAVINGSNGEMKYLLPAKPAEHARKKCAVIDLDETLVHSSFKPISNADFIVPVEIDGTTHEVYVLKRPHVDTYLERMGEMYECVLFTASLAKYADPVADLLDKTGVFSWRLFRESCVFHHGNYVKDLNLIGRDLNKMIIIDNSPASYSFHPNNAVPVLSWFDDPSDTELLDILPFLEAIAESDDVYSVLRNHGFTSHAVRNTDYLKQHQQMQMQHQQQQQNQQQIITSVEQDDEYREEGQER